MKRLFGTDGIRGVAGESPLDAATVRLFGAALGRVVQQEIRTRKDQHTPTRAAVVLGRDTRESGDWLRNAVACGLASEGVHAIDAGVITTPGLALCARRGDFDAGVMISASHNPFHDNGLKVFGHDGTKLPDAMEREIEALILDHGLADPGNGEDPTPEIDPELQRWYIDYLEQCVSGERAFSGARIVLDCANGSASSIAPETFRFHGAEIEVIGAAPDGRNINLDCGSTHLDRMAQVVKDGGYDMGIAFDGDADRALAVDRKGRIVDGDHILYLLARRLKQDGALDGDAVVATIMSNLWLEQRLEAEGIRLLRAPVGDKYVRERMMSEDSVLGGEQSGHIIFSRLATTGDGILTGLLLLETLKRSDQPLEAILDGITPCPQVLLNVRVSEKPDLREHATIGPAVRSAEESLGSEGRVVLRYSGTEPLARVMVEGNDAGQVKRHAEDLVAVIERELGG
ncbi:hypothetical protein ABI59_11030 [Acidobacteria bacterium Mor1]|nr:hypothetical protein ABI59_11030 [Acidobacteria bacterium Mor1]